MACAILLSASSSLKRQGNLTENSCPPETLLAAAMKLPMLKKSVSEEMEFTRRKLNIHEHQMLRDLPLQLITQSMARLCHFEYLA